MAQVGYFTWTSPTSNATIYMDTSRNGATVTVTATVVCTLTYSSGYINYDGEINFNMWCNGASASANIKGYSDRWAANTARTRTRTCSMSFTSTASSIVVGYNMSIPSSRPSGAAFRIGDQYPTLGFPSYNAPSAPTWTNINPNPCSILSAPVITWGGAGAGSLGRLYYDVQVRSTTPSGSWTGWLNISSAQGGTSFREVVLKNMNVNGQKPFVGVKYQYRIRSSDGSYATSGWVNTPELSVSFGTPTPPTNITQSDASIKKDGSITIGWSGADGGTGTISSYSLDYRIYNHSTSSWTNWSNAYTGSNTSYTFDMTNFYQDAKNGDLLQFRIRVKNSWGQNSDYFTMASIKVKGNQLWFKVNGSWVEADCYYKYNGVWIEAAPYLKVAGVWKEST